MNKTALSLILLTASGGYVAWANNAFDGLSTAMGPAAAAVLPEVALTETAPPVTSSLAPPPAARIPELRHDEDDDDDEEDDDDHAAFIGTIAPTPVGPVPASAPEPVLAAAPDPAPLVAAPFPAPPPDPALRKPAPPTALKVAAASSLYRDGTFQGSVENAYYGYVQVQAVIQNGSVVKVDVLSYPSDRRTSRRINAQALPILEQEVVRAQSGRVNLVTGATLTSRAYIASLTTALRSAASNA